MNRDMAVSQGKCPKIMIFTAFCRTPRHPAGLNVEKSIATMVGNFLRVPKLPKTTLFREFRRGVRKSDVCEMLPDCKIRFLTKGDLWQGNVIFVDSSFVFLRDFSFVFYRQTPGKADMRQNQGKRIAGNTFFGTSRHPS